MSLAGELPSRYHPGYITGPGSNTSACCISMLMSLMGASIPDLPGHPLARVKKQHFWFRAPKFNLYLHSLFGFSVPYCNQQNLSRAFRSAAVLVRPNPAMFASGQPLRVSAGAKGQLLYKVSVSEGHLPRGAYPLRLRSGTGGFNLNYPIRWLQSPGVSATPGTSSRVPTRHDPSKSIRGSRGFDPNQAPRLLRPSGGGEQATKVVDPPQLYRHRLPKWGDRCLRA